MGGKRLEVSHWEMTKCKVAHKSIKEIIKREKKMMPRTTMPGDDENESCSRPYYAALSGDRLVTFVEVLVTVVVVEVLFVIFAFVLAKAPKFNLFGFISRITSSSSSAGDKDLRRALVRVLALSVAGVEGSFPFPFFPRTAGKRTFGAQSIEGE